MLFAEPLQSVVNYFCVLYNIFTNSTLFGQPFLFCVIHIFKSFVKKCFCEFYLHNPELFAIFRGKGLINPLKIKLCFI